MKLDDIRVAPKLWGTIMGLLVVMLASAAFTQNRASVAMVGALEEVEQNEVAILKRPGFRGGSNTGEWSHEEVLEVFA